LAIRIIINPSYSTHLFDLDLIRFTVMINGMRPEAYESILVSCPDPAGQHMGEMTVAQFRAEKPDIAERVIDPLLAVAKVLEESGMDEQTAADMAFKAVAVLDEAGSIKRVEVPEAEAATGNQVAELELAGSKKK
jgi:hypothetical protein